MSSTTSPSDRTAPALGAAVLLWLAGNGLRLTILAVPPVIAMIRDDLRLNATQVGLLSSIPPAMFAIAALAGSLLVHTVGPLPAPMMLAYPLAMALCFSAYVVMTRALRGEDMRANLFYTALGVFLALTPALPGLWVTPNAHDLVVMVAVGVLGYFALWALDRSTAAAPVSLAAPVAYMQIAFTFALFIGLGMMGHGMSVRRLALGLLLIVGAALYVWISESRLRLRDALATPAPH